MSTTMTVDAPQRPATTGVCPACNEVRYLTQRDAVVIHAHATWSRLAGRTVARRCTGSGQPPVGNAPADGQEAQR